MPLTVQSAFDVALRSYQAGQLADAETFCRRILAVHPNHAGTLYLLGVIASSVGQLANAAEMIRRAIEQEPGNAIYHDALGLALAAQGQLEAAAAAHRTAIQLQENFPMAHCNLGNALQRLGQIEAAVGAYRRAIDFDPGMAQAHSNLGVAYHALGLLEEAIAAYSTAVRLQPRLVDIHFNLGNALRDHGQLKEAVIAYRNALGLKPEDYEIRNSLGDVLRRQGCLEAAVAECRTAISMKPDYAEAYNNLAIAYQMLGQLDNAVVACKKAVALRPDFAVAWHSLGSALKDQGQMAESIAASRRAVLLEPTNTAIHSNLLYHLQFLPGCDAELLDKEAAHWNALHAPRLRRYQWAHTNTRDLERRIRVGYLSPNFSGHVIGRNIWPLLRCHDRQNFEIFCYSDVTRPDTLTAMFRACAEHWRHTVGVSHIRLAEQIIRDGVDILVDLSLHTEDNRLPLFVSRPAPVQISFAGYPGSAGVEGIRHHLSDPYLEPGNAASHQPHDEAIYLESFWCYDPIDTLAAINPLPILEAGHLTYGCLTNFCKINEPVLKLWAGVLRLVNESRLLLLSPPGSHRQRTVDLFQSEGIDPTRISFAEPCPRQTYLELYHRIDIALDPFPYNGHTTSLDALWMGVPFVSLAGKVPVSRAGLSVLSNLGLSELVADSMDAYVRIASDLAHDLPRLSQLRATLRRRMETSVLMDAPRFARNIETAYRMLWQQWCAANPGESRTCPTGSGTRSISV